MGQQLWVRVGDAGDYESFDSDLDALLDYLNELQVGNVTEWIEDGRGVGFTTPNYHGYDFISLFWGDENANLVRRLNAGERAAVECCLEEAFI